MNCYNTKAVRAYLENIGHLSHKDEITHAEYVDNGILVKGIRGKSGASFEFFVEYGEVFDFLFEKLYG